MFRSKLLILHWLLQDYLWTISFIIIIFEHNHPLYTSDSITHILITFPKLHCFYFICINMFLIIFTSVLKICNLCFNSEYFRFIFNHVSLILYYWMLVLNLLFDFGNFLLNWFQILLQESYSMVNIVVLP